MFNKRNLDFKMMDIYNCENEETPREFIFNSEEEFGMEHGDLGEMNDEQINAYIEFLDYLWNK